jgi:hypothetical protein
VDEIDATDQMAKIGNRRARGKIKTPRKPGISSDPETANMQTVLAGL